MEERRGIRTWELSLRRSTVMILVLDLLIGALLFYYMYQTSEQFSAVQQATEEYAEYQSLTTELKEGIDYLSNAARSYTVNLDPEQVILYYNELTVTNRRDEAYERLTEVIDDPRVQKHLESVITLSDAMRAKEEYAMRLAAEALGQNVTQYPAALQEIRIAEEDLRLPAEEMLSKARALVFNTEYETMYGQMRTRISLSVEHLLEGLQDVQLSGADQVARLLGIERMLVYIFVILMLLAVVFIFQLVIRPLRKNITHIQQEEMLEVEGTSEMTFLARTFNTMLTQIQQSQKQLTFEASHDALTGLYNRNAYDNFMVELRGDNAALLILDVDHFKEYNDSYGHDVGDKVLRRVSAVLGRSFRVGDRICRIGGDEFAVIMQRVGPTMHDLIRERITAAAGELADPLEDVPAVTLSVGAAFSASVSPNRSVFKCADMALYHVKHKGGNGCCIYGIDVKEEQLA